MAVFLCVIVFKVVSIQYTEGDKYQKLATEITKRQDTIYANKGNVYSSDGKLLATSVSKYTIRMDAMTVKKEVFDKNIAALSKSLSALLGKSVAYYYKKIRNARKKKNRYLLIARNIGYHEYIKMKTFPIFKLGIYKGGFIAEHKTVREHPIGKIAERTIGYHDYRGEAGIEGAFADEMTGVNGLRWKQKIAKNQWKPINDVNEKEPLDGSDVITTIDVNIQDITHHALLRQLEYFEADHGCAVVMETATGEIRAISNLGKTPKGKYYEKRNYAIWEAHEPGSTFKLASLMAAIDDKMIDTATVVDTERGKIFIHGDKVEDSQTGGYGIISAARAFEVSSNVGIVKLIRKHYDHQPEKFYSKMKQFGLTEKIGIPIKGEGNPYIRNPKDKKNWYKTSLEWMSWGYGISLTPLQMLTFYNAIANDGVMVKPQFIKELRHQNKTTQTFKTEVIRSQIASPSTIRKVKKVLENVVLKGTADNIYSSNFSMAGKTGTAKKYITSYTDKKGNRVPGGYSGERYIASFAGFFPVDKPKYSCIVVIHDPNKEKGYYGATVAAPVFKEIAQKIYTNTPVDDEVDIHKEAFKSIEKLYTAHHEKIQKNYTKVPDVSGMPVMDAIPLLENIGLKIKTFGVGKVQSQSIQSGEKLVKGKTIVLKLL
ncbi:MAG: PASTA domain-containing protein [Flavobacteriaceae bacterium]|nr:MAG: PASTA domain-containing protein [Flavobacteriaceae bacterium]